MLVLLEQWNAETWGLEAVRMVGGEEGVAALLPIYQLSCLLSRIRAQAR